MAISCRNDAIISWCEALEKTGLLPPEVRRIIIDIPLEDPVKVYYECFGDERMFTIDLANMLGKAEAIGVRDMPHE